MTKRTVTSTIRVCRQITKAKEVDVTINVPEDASPEDERMLLEEAALEKAHDEDFNTGTDYDEPTYFLG